MEKTYFSKNIDQRLPPDYSIFIKNSQITGISYRREDVIKFIHSEGLCLALELEPSNTMDINAIKLIGKTDGADYLLGYIARGYAQQIADSGMFQQLLPRLMRVYQGKDDYVDITFQILGPKDLKEKFGLFKPIPQPSEEHLEFLSFLNIEIPDDASLEDVIEIIGANSDSGISLFNQYSSMMEELCSSEFCETYGLEGIERQSILDLINKMISEGKAFKDVIQSDEEIFERLVEGDF
jgi:hypothetical protein